MKFDSMNEVESLPGENIPDIPVKTGILMLENPCDMGTIEIISSAGSYVPEWDYSDWEGSIGEVCVVRVTPRAGYLVDAVLLDGEPLEPGEDGTFSLTVEREMAELKVTYAEDSVPADPSDDVTDDNDPPGVKSAAGDSASPANGFGESSSGDISYDITVTYEGAEDSVPMVGAESTVGSIFSGSSSSGSSLPVLDAGDEPEASVLEPEDDFEPPDVPEDTSDTEDPGMPEAEKICERTPKEDDAPAPAVLAKARDESLPESVETAAVEKPGKPIDAADRGAFGVLLAGAVLSVLSAYLTRKR